MKKEEKVKNCYSNIDTIIKRFKNNDYDIVDVERKIKDLIAQIYNDFESENERLKAERDKILDEVKDEMVDKFDADPMVRRISNMVINEIKSRHKTP